MRASGEGARRDPRGRGTPGGERDAVAWSSAPREPAPAPAKASPAPAKATRVHVRLERQGRAGKVVTVVRGLPGHPEAIEDVARRLKAACGAGGTTEGRDVLVQGDHRDRVVAILVGLGLDARRA